MVRRKAHEEAPRPVDVLQVMQSLVTNDVVLYGYEDHTYTKVNMVRRQAPEEAPRPLDVFQAMQLFVVDAILLADILLGVQRRASFAATQVFASPHPH